MESTQNSSEPTLADIWQTLSAVNVEDYVETKMGLRYLSWAHGWMTLMQHYPNAIMDFPPSEVHEDGSVTVNCSIVIGTFARHMWLPVMNNKNQAIVRPNARDISDAKMRCLVKCMALFGLGLYVYAGEELPRAEESKVEDKSPKKKPEPKAKAEPAKAPPPKESESEMTENEARAFADGMSQFLELMTSVDGLNSYYKENISTITTVQNQFQDIYNEMIAAFKTRKKQIEEGEADNG